MEDKVKKIIEEIRPQLQNDGGDIELVSVDVATGKVLSVQNQSTENGANVHQWEYTGNASQEWSIWQMSDGTYKIVNRQSGKCLNLQDSSLADNANIQQWQETPWSQSFYWNIDYVY